MIELKKEHNKKYIKTWLSKEKGITLVALVVTIVILLILLTVTIEITINGNLIDDSRKLAQETQNVVDEKEKLENILLQEQKGVLPDGIKVGDYVNYTPTSSEYTVSDEVTGLTGYSSATGSQTFKTQTGSEALQWKIWSINKEKGIIEIIATTQTTGKLRLRGADGYNHAVDILNDMCKELYSNGKAVARNMSIQDINQKTTYDPNTYTNYGKQPYTYTDGKYPKIYDAELGCTSDMLMENEATKKLLRESQGVRKADGSADYTKYTGYNSKTSLNPTHTYYSYTPEEYLKNNVGEKSIMASLINTGTAYWLSSRYVEPTSTVANFGLYIFGADGSMKSRSLFDSGENLEFRTNAFRPIVSMPDNTAWTEAETQINDTTTWDIKF